MKELRSIQMEINSSIEQLKIIVDEKDLFSLKVRINRLSLTNENKQRTSLSLRSNEFISIIDDFYFYARKCLNCFSRNAEEKNCNRFFHSIFHRVDKLNNKILHHSTDISIH